MELVYHHLFRKKHGYMYLDYECVVFIISAFFDSCLGFFIQLNIILEVRRLKMKIFELV